MKFILGICLLLSCFFVTRGWTGLAVDYIGNITADHITCLRKNNYTAIFIRVSSGNIFDLDSITTINNAISAGIGVEPYFIPDILSKIPASAQVMNIYNSLEQYFVTIRRLWVQVRDPNTWYATPFGLQQNIEFFNETIHTIRNLTWNVGVFTTNGDWNTIMGNWASNDLYMTAANLWYTNTTGPGVDGETSQDFSDFQNFGIWSKMGNTQPNVKQFGVNETVCNLNVNRNFYYFPNL